MKSTLIFSLLTVLSFSFFGSISPDDVQVKPKYNAPARYKVEQISKMRIQLDSVDKYYDGMCDTCVAAFRGAIIENRILAQRISEQSFAMKELIEQNEKLLKVDSIRAEQ